MKTQQMKIIASVMAGMTALAILAGCNTSPNVMQGSEGPAGNMAAFISISNPSLQNNITMERVIHKRVNNILQASAIIKSHSKKTQEFEYRFQWYDADGVEIRDTKTHWVGDRIFGMEEKQLQGIAPNEAANTFRLMIRKPEPLTR